MDETTRDTYQGLSSKPPGRILVVMLQPMVRLKATCNDKMAKWLKITFKVHRRRCKYDWCTSRYYINTKVYIVGTNELCRSKL